MFLQDVEELQLHNDEGAVVSRKRRQNYDAATKLEAVNWARKNSIKGYPNISSAAREFKVDRQRVKEWIKQENELKRLV